MPSRRSPRLPAASRVKKPTPTPGARTASAGGTRGSARATAGQGNLSEQGPVDQDADKEKEEDNADHPCACPYCGKLGQECDDHLLINIDVTFGEVWGPASDLFHEFVYRDEDGETRSRTLAFVSACEEVAVCRDHYFEGGPGMSSHDYWCWSRDPAKALEELKAELVKLE